MNWKCCIVRILSRTVTWTLLSCLKTKDAEVASKGSPDQDSNSCFQGIRYHWIFDALAQLLGSAADIDVWSKGAGS